MNFVNMNKTDAMAPFIYRERMSLSDSSKITRQTENAKCLQKYTSAFHNIIGDKDDACTTSFP